MIRPITMICWILALGTGLYLYRAKHEVELMDRHIEQIAKETADLRVESRRLLDDWIRLGEPEQLRKYSDQYLGLKSIAPTQFVRLVDLPSRLAAPRPDPVEDAAPSPEPPPLVQLPGGGATQKLILPAARSAGMDDAEVEDVPLPPVPPVGAVSSPGSIAPAPVATVPLQARPVSPRPIASQQTDDAPRIRAATEAVIGEQTHFQPVKQPEPKPAPLKSAEPRPVAQTAQGQSPQGQMTIGQSSTSHPATGQPGRGQPQSVQAAVGQSATGQTAVGQSVMGQTANQARSVPVVSVRELPPLQAQGGGPMAVQTVSQTGGQWVNQRPASTQNPGYPPLRPAEARIGATRTSERPATGEPPQATVSPPTGSLLGMAHGVTPTLPGPTQVNATWTNAVGR